MKLQHTVIAAMAMLIGGCNTLKYLAPEQKLYTGASVKVTSPDRMKTKNVRKIAEKVVSPKPNQTIAGIRFKLWFYEVAGEGRKGFKKWLKNEAGERPVLYDAEIPVRVSEIMVNRLYNLGYFDARVKYQVVEKNKKKVQIVYEVTVTRPYTIASVNWPQATDTLSARIRETETETLLKPGTTYDLDVIKQERARIDQSLKNQGFYFFNPDNLLFKADSTRGSKTVAMRLTVKSDIADKAARPYRINKVFIYPGYRARDTARTDRPDTLKIDGFHYITRDSTFKPRSITRSVFLHPGDLYSRKAYGTSVNRLMSMGVFGNVNVRFTDTVIGNRGKLDAFVRLTPSRKRSVQIELLAVTKSNNYTGPAMTVSYKNRNLFRAAELLILNLDGNFETQITGKQKGFNSYAVGLSSQLFLPRFLLPFKVTNPSSLFLPRTKFEAGFRNLNRVLYFKMNAINFSFGYQWKETATKQHELNPIDFNFTTLLSTTDDFDKMLAEDAYLRKSFEQQFTIGQSYAFTYNSLLISPGRNGYYFNGAIDLSGNIISAVQSRIKGRKPTETDYNTIFGYRYSQFSKFTTDSRYYFTINKNSRIASRVIAGAGFPYGNSSTMPYIKQFFSGGSGSIRAFLPRTIGPGTYEQPDSINSTFPDQAGEIKLEGNVEYRFTMISVLKGALFVDAGNVWLVHKNDQLPGGEFQPNLFYRQLAVGTGFGVRLDVSFFVLRLDLGMPLRRPNRPEGEQWVLDEIDFSSRSWRSRNLVLNIAIGYPF